MLIERLRVCCLRMINIDLLLDDYNFLRVSAVEKGSKPKITAEIIISDKIDIRECFIKLPF